MKLYRFSRQLAEHCIQSLHGLRCSINVLHVMRNNSFAYLKNALKIDYSHQNLVFYVFGMVQCEQSFGEKMQLIQISIYLAICWLIELERRKTVHWNGKMEKLNSQLNYTSENVFFPQYIGSFFILSTILCVITFSNIW